METIVKDVEAIRGLFSAFRIEALRLQHDIIKNQDISKEIAALRASLTKNIIFNSTIRKDNEIRKIYKAAERIIDQLANQTNSNVKAELTRGLLNITNI